MVEDHPFILEVFKKGFNEIENVGYLGLGSLYYGHPNEKLLRANISPEDEKTLFEQRLKWLLKSPKNWGENHHLAGTTAEVNTGIPGNYTVLVSPEPVGWKPAP